MSKELAGKVVIITGASSGIGHATALEMVKSGAKVIVTARREELLKEISGALAIPCDLKNPEEIQNLVDTTIKTYGTVDILINIAGIGWYNWIEKLTHEEIQEQYATNVTAMAILISKVVPYMKKQKHGTIVNVSSYASRIAIPPLTIYASTKYAIEGLSDALRRELAPWNIKVTRIHPWAVNTDFNAKAAGNGGIVFPDKLGIPFMKLTMVTPEKVAKEIIHNFKNPKKAIYITRLSFLINIVTTLNYFFPSVVDFGYGFYVRKMMKDTKIDS